MQSEYLSTFLPSIFIYDIKFRFNLKFQKLNLLLKKDTKVWNLTFIMFIHIYIRVNTMSILKLGILL